MVECMVECSFSSTYPLHLHDDAWTRKWRKKNSNLPSQICCWNNGWNTYCDHKSTQPIQLTSSDWCSTFEVMTLRHVESMSEFNSCANHVSIFEMACVLHGFYRNMVLDHGWFFRGQTTTQGFHTYYLYQYLVLAVATSYWYYYYVYTKTPVCSQYVPHSRPQLGTSTAYYLRTASYWPLR